jgi:hypothetical protein
MNEIELNEATAPRSVDAPCSALIVSVTHREADELRLAPREVWIDTWQVRLTVGNQSFDVGPKSETEAEAQWAAERLREALYRQNASRRPVNRRGAKIRNGGRG